MGLYQKWMSLPVKARYYVGFSTIVMAVIGDYVTTRINDEVKARDSIIAQMEYDSQQKKN
ncbi:unnamed protein product [Candida parapsilosis]|uniref:Uncharacterized protein n=1 Tax=Candida parapsilosis (strain CDC 317 / ATCC MYA-4646) TaxID=578454 RepID=G8B7E9_CANPC|nr:uncharacterized protein CPAR2_104195 [Candida parapsilosis]CAD1809734.1 unnamed protein product [Candida parapsilosis]CCE40383.1 hypothetical protein CPAR2_104195 [Candida parapsilosis]